MSLLNRKPRPIARVELKERDDRIFIIATDDKHAPKQYFDGLEFPRVKVKVLPCEDGKSAPVHVVDSAVAFKARNAKECEVLADDEFWLLLDVDHNLKDQHKTGFVTALDKAKKNGFGIAVSNPCFEVWLLCHHADCEKGKGFENGEAVVKQLQAAAGGYDKTNLNSAKFCAHQIPAAIQRARALEIDPKNLKGYWPENPGSRIYPLLEKIIG
jgi:hypothetical protein